MDVNVYVSVWVCVWVRCLSVSGCEGVFECVNCGCELGGVCDCMSVCRVYVSLWVCGCVCENV